MSELKIRDEEYQIKPAGRHIITIGRDLIKDKFAAIVELVKNSYDADATFCKISLLPFEKIDTTDTENVIKGIKVVVVDDGHGMTYDTVVNKWMVPSTDDKWHRIKSPKGRIMQGKKGIGRYSASMIGDDLILETVIDKGERTTLYLEWKDFQNAKYLSDVNILIENYHTEKSPGTELVMFGDESHLKEWTEKQIQNLKFELKKLIPPSYNSKGRVEDFKIQLELGDFPFENFSNLFEDIEPYPLVDLFDYRISGKVSKDGFAKLKFENNRINGALPEEFKEFKINLNKKNKRKSEESYCGEIKIDFRVFDRDPLSIDGLIERGLKDPLTGKYVGKNDAKALLNKNNGIGVYRNGFRIRPLGDPGYDWLELDKERVQNPSMKIGSDQIIGFIHIQSEEYSGLEEKSARDGLKESSEYFGLQEISKQILLKLEHKRFIYRQKLGLGRSNKNISEKINTLFNFDEVKSQITAELGDIGVSKDKIEKINKILIVKENINNKIADDLKKSIALYQGQATIGKIVNVIMHEGKKPLSYFINQFPRIEKWSNKLKEQYDQALLEKIIDRLSVAREQSFIFERLFKKIDPLSSKRKTNKSDFYIRKVIEDVRDVFSSELEEKNIKYEIECDKSLLYKGWKEDFYVVFTNLVDNSIYWLLGNEDKERIIKFKVYIDYGLLIIEYKDNGPGIEKEYIESEVIFEPEFSNKTGSGSGLGLAISGEAIQRNNGELKAIYSNSGAFFKVEVKL